MKSTTEKIIEGLQKPTWTVDSPPSVLSDLLSHAFTILGDIVDENECNYDHHGNCQEHGWSDPDIPCPHKRAKEWLIKVGKIQVG